MGGKHGRGTAHAPPGSRRTSAPGALAGAGHAAGVARACAGQAAAPVQGSDDVHHAAHAAAGPVGCVSRVERKLTGVSTGAAAARACNRTLPAPAVVRGFCLLP